MKPDFVIIGAQKAGSTTLMRYLDHHPAVFLPRNETRYFRDPWYATHDESVLDAAVGTRDPAVARRGIKCPDLLTLPSAPGRIRDALGDDVRLIAVLRDPVSRAVSGYYWSMQWAMLPIEDIETGLPRLLDGTLGAGWPRASEVLDYGRYGAGLQRFVDVFGAERLLVLRDTELRADPAAATARICRFLDVEPVAAMPQLRVVNPGTYSLRRLRFQQRRNPFVLREYPGVPGRYVEQPRRYLPWLYVQGLRAIDQWLLARVCAASAPQLSPGLRRRLEEYYADDARLTMRLLGLADPPWPWMTTLDGAA